jgi:hypothetical protein
MGFHFMEVRVFGLDLPINEISCLQITAFKFRGVTGKQKRKKWIGKLVLGRAF